MHFSQKMFLKANQLIQKELTLAVDRQENIMLVSL